MSKTKRKEKKERVDFIMRKSIKKMAAAMLTATMLMGLGTTAFAADLDTASIPAGTFVYTLTGNMTDPSWASMDDANVMQQAKDVNGNDIAGVYSMHMQMTTKLMEQTLLGRESFLVTQQQQRRMY